MGDMILFTPMLQITASAVPCGDNRMNSAIRTSMNFLQQLVAEKRPKPGSIQFLQQPVAEIGNIAVPPPAILSQAVRELPTSRHAKLAVTVPWQMGGPLRIAPKIPPKWRNRSFCGIMFRESCK